MRTQRFNHFNVGLKVSVWVLRGLTQEWLLSGSMVFSEVAFWCCQCPQGMYGTAGTNCLHQPCIMISHLDTRRDDMCRGAYYYKMS